MKSGIRIHIKTLWICHTAPQSWGLKISKNLHGMHSTVEMIFVVCIPPRRWSPQWAARWGDCSNFQHFIPNIFSCCFLKIFEFGALVSAWRQELQIRKNLHGVQHTAEMISEVCISPLSQSQWCGSYRRDNRRGVHHTAETNCTLQRQNWNLYLALVAFKGIIRGNPLRDEHIYHERKDLKNKMCLLRKICGRTLCLNTSANSKPNSKILLTCYQGPRRVQIMKKNGGKKSRDTLPLKIEIPNSETQLTLVENFWS